MRVKIWRKGRHEIVDLNRRRAIREKCLDCSESPVDVRHCEFKNCELYQFRSGQGKQDAKVRSKMIKQFCLWCMNGQRSEVTKCPSKYCSLFPFRQTKIDRSVDLNFNGKK